MPVVVLLLLVVIYWLFGIFVNRTNKENKERSKNYNDLHANRISVNEWLKRDYEIDKKYDKYNIYK